MSTKETAGGLLHSDDAEARREAARMLGSAKTEKKTAHCRAVAESQKGKKRSPEVVARIRAGVQSRRERVRLERLALGLVEEPTEKKPPGRPRTRPEADTTAGKRSVGRPKKSVASETLSEGNLLENGF